MLVLFRSSNTAPQPCTPVASKNPFQSRLAPKMSSQRGNGYDPAIMTLLEENSVKIGGERITIREAIARENSDRPSEALAIRLHNILRYSVLSIKQKQDLFRFIGWHFMCISCRTTHPAREFGGTAFYLWGPVEPARVMLRSGPCKKCQDDRRDGTIRQAIEPFNIYMPPECER